MQVRGKLTLPEVKEIPNFNKSLWAWPRILLRNAYGLLLLIAMTGGTIAKAASGSREHWLGVSLIWLVIAGIIVWAVWNTQRNYQKAFAKLRKQLPEWLIFDDEGMRTETKRGRTTFHPWSEITVWQKGRSLIRLTMAEGGFMFVPFSDLSFSERNNLEELFENHVQGST